MIVEKMMMAIASEKTRKPSSLAQLCSVLPRMRSPAECRENLKILHESRHPILIQLNTKLLSDRQTQETLC